MEMKGTLVTLEELVQQCQEMKFGDTVYFTFTGEDLPDSSEISDALVAGPARYQEYKNERLPGRKVDILIRYRCKRIRHGSTFQVEAYGRREDAGLS